MLKVITSVVIIHLNIFNLFLKDKSLSNFHIIVVTICHICMKTIRKNLKRDSCERFNVYIYKKTCQNQKIHA